MYANRSCNQVAHVLARQVSDDIRMGEWHSVPSCVLHLLTEDGNPVDSWSIESSSSRKKKFITVHIYYISVLAVWNGQYHECLTSCGLNCPDIGQHELQVLTISHTHNTLLTPFKKNTLLTSSSRAVFSCRFGTANLGLRATVFRSEHCSAFCFLVQKIVQKLIN
jgi:hypothetical protein